MTFIMIHLKGWVRVSVCVLMLDRNFAYFFSFDFWVFANGMTVYLLFCVKLAPK